MNEPKRIYLDYNATTPCDERSNRSDAAIFTQFGNPASRHWGGYEAEKAVGFARLRVAEFVGASPTEIIWTSGATEANNLAIRGVAGAAVRAGFGKHVVTQATEHKAVLDPVERLREEGMDVTILPVDEDGRVSPERLHDAVRPDTALVSIMWANNETGTIQDMEALVQAAKMARPDVIFHSDATQAVGKLPDVSVGVGVDLMSLTAHKLYGPKGCGALYVRRRRPRIGMDAIIYGGGHERGLRSGTLNVAGIVGFGAACNRGRRGSEWNRKIDPTTRSIWERLSIGIGHVYQNGCTGARLPNTLSISAIGTSAESLLLACNEIAMSSGSACTSASIEPSHVLRAMGFSETRCFSSIRLSLGRFTTEEEVEYTAERLKATILAMRLLSGA